MTSLSLLFWIVGGILLQLTIYLCIEFWHHWRNFQTLRTAVIEEGLPIQAHATPDAAEPAAAAWQGWRTFKVTQKTLENITQDICSFHLTPQDGKPLPSFFPGQYLTFQLAIPVAGGATESVMRCYSLSDQPHPDSYRVSIKRAPAPANSRFAPGRSSNFFHDQVQVGSLLQVRAPAGHFHIDRSNAPVVLVGGGIGITPMLSMLNDSLASHPDREIWLFYGARHQKELMAQPHLQALAARHHNFHLHLCLSHPQPEDLTGVKHLQSGRIDLDLFRRLLPLKPYHFYICGPTPLLQSLVPALEDWGVPDARVHFEAFGPASVRRKKAAPQATNGPVTSSELTVTFSKSGKQLPWQAEIGSLLALAEAHGIAVNSGCRAGGCGSCQTTIRSGEVGYQQAPDHDPEPGTCLMCVCTPKTNVTLEL